MYFINSRGTVEWESTLLQNELALPSNIRSLGNKERSLPLRLITYAEHLSSFAILIGIHIKKADREQTWNISSFARGKR